MIPYSEVKFQGNSYFIHGIPHPTSIYSLKRSYVKSVRDFVESSIAKGENWYCEDGFNLYFGVSAKRIKEFEMPNAITIVKNLLLAIRSYKKMEEEKGNPRILAAMNLESIDDLIHYRKMFHPGVDLIIAVMEFNCGLKTSRYENLIERCLKQIREITKDGKDAHLLTGIAHEFVLKNIEWSLVFDQPIQQSV
ncbi:MAG: hypothetical protein QXM68_04280 [Candidatus Aenigmatarchaeota archaeon]|nr:hypothetical protein [Candidatus Aenigmarchaeota archaeon]